ncbi:MAG TPA: hypothetical protein VMZ53_10935 [Kofleriaceae bacterium]|nr:hypothetical protein [Kofleriaceae bacterium]
MRNRLFVLAIVLCADVAHADEVDDLVAKGQELAKQSEFTQAIATFKQADAKRPRAAHACMIGLAYMRREAWPQAELFLALCEKRAAPGDQPPEWIDEAKKQLAQKLTAAQIPAVTIDVTPPNIGAHLTVSSFAPDEVFDPQTIHLAPGTHVIEVTAPGYRSERKDVVVEPAKPQHVTFEMQRAGDAVAPVSPRQPERGSHSKVPWLVGGAGVAIGVAGIVYHATSVSAAYDRADGAETMAAYNVLVDDFNSKRNVAVGLYAASSLTIGVAVVLRFTVYKDASEPPLVTAQLGDHGAGILIGWQR